MPHRTHAIHCAANHLHPPPHPITQAHPQYAYMQLRKYFINGVANLLAIVTSSNCTQLTENHKARMEALYAEMVEVLKDPHAEGFVHMPKNFKKVRGRHPLTPPPAAHPTERVLLLTPQSAAAMRRPGWHPRARPDRTECLGTTSRACVERSWLSGGAHTSSTRGISPANGARTDSMVLLWQLVFDGVASYGSHYPSSKHDFDGGGQIEVESLNGYIVLMAKKQGIAAPANTRLVKQVRQRRSRGGAGGGEWARGPNRRGQCSSWGCRYTETCFVQVANRTNREFGRKEMSSRGRLASPADFPLSRTVPVLTCPPVQHEISLVQGPFSVASCQPLLARLATFVSLCADGSPRVSLCADGSPRVSTGEQHGAAAGPLRGAEGLGGEAGGRGAGGAHTGGRALPGGGSALPTGEHPQQVDRDRNVGR